MAHDQATKDKLRRLYVFERLSLEIAAGQCGVSFATARRWKDKAETAGDNWEKLRAAHTMAGKDLEDIARQLLTDLVLQFKATMDALAREDIPASERVTLLTSLSDSYNKAISANKKLLPETSRLAVALEVLEKLADWLKTKRPELLGAFLDELEPFGAMLEKELK
jgi:hypothetical protein|nr:MAG TPA: Protein of unknown function (DUF1804) [Caudoviricetes sp.]